MRQCIPGGYVAEVQGRVWEEFIDHVVGLLIEAADRIVQKKPGFDYQAEASWWATRKRKVRKQDVRIAFEDSVTDALRRSLDSIRKELPSGDFFRRNNIYIAEQQPRLRQRRLGPRAQTTDLQFASLDLDYLDLRVEAKPLFDNNDADRYCGPDGLLRFADSQPYTDKAVGMMLGFTFRHDDDHWHNRIADVASGKYGVDAFETVNAGNRALRTSAMKWRGTNDVRVVHLMLSFPSSPCARDLDTAANGNSGYSASIDSGKRS